MSETERHWSREVGKIMTPSGMGIDKLLDAEAMDKIRAHWTPELWHETLIGTIRDAAKELDGVVTAKVGPMVGNIIGATRDCVDASPYKVIDEVELTDGTKTKRVIVVIEEDHTEEQIELTTLYGSETREIRIHDMLPPVEEEVKP